MKKRTLVAVSVATMILVGLVTDVSAPPGPDPLSQIQLGLAQLQTASTTAHATLSQKVVNLMAAVDPSSGGTPGTPSGGTPSTGIPSNNPGGQCPSNSSRFTCVMGDAAVRDNETKLVWETAPDMETTNTDWTSARLHCANTAVGGRKGWRLPSFAELSSLVDPSVAFPGPTLPPSHPFQNVVSANYWSATTLADFSANAWHVDFSTGGVFPVIKDTNSGNAWCVRGGTQEHEY